MLSTTVSSGLKVASRLLSSSAVSCALTTSLLPTYHFQPSLPRLEIPPLDDTCRRYLDAVSPLAPSESALQATRAAVESFRTGIGRELDAQLRARDKLRTNTSYISDPWYDMYLTNRDPLPININPFLMFQDDENASGEGAQTVRAAAMIWSSLRFHSLLSQEKLEPEVYHTNPKLSQAEWWPKTMKAIPPVLSWYGAYLTGAYPLDMSQFKRLFASSRIPKPVSDVLTDSFDSTVNPYIVVVSRGRFYKLSTDMNTTTPAGIRASLDEIVAHSAKSQVEPHFRVGSLTTEKRTTWAFVREAMSASPESASSLETIDRALFVLCLDDTDANSPEEIGLKFLCGNHDNRWFDKSFQLIVTPNGTAAVNFEHAWGDGVAVMRYFNEVWADSKSYVSAARQSGPASSPAPLQWDLSAAVRASVLAAAARADDDAARLNIAVDIFDGFGKRWLKKRGLSPDAALQMAFQLAYKRMHNAVVPTYESASTSGFRFGRTETIRTVSSASVEWVNSMTSQTTNSTRRSLFVRACQTHAKRSMDAVMGKGCDRHLFALRFLAAEKNLPKPAIYEDAAYARINHNILSTSTLVSEACRGGGFGPVVADGYGVGYGSFDDFIGFQISNFKDAKPSTDAATFIKHIRVALSEIATINDAP